jgi:hypothetical protein
LSRSMNTLHLAAPCCTLVCLRHHAASQCDCVTMLQAGLLAVTDPHSWAGRGLICCCHAEWN